MASRLGIRGRFVDLLVRFTDAAGNPVNADDTPLVKITDSNGTIRQAFSKSGVSVSDDPGLYVLSYEIPLNFPDGYALDTWQAVIGGETITNTFDFLVIQGGYATEGEFQDHEPGHPYDFNFTKEETYGVNAILKIVKKRVKNDGTRKVVDPNDPTNYIIVPCNIFTDSELICFIINSLSEFNAYPHFTNFTFASPEVVGIFLDILAQGAVLLALAAQALIERGREFSITDNGVTYQPPAISEMLNSQYGQQLADYKEKLKIIKCNIKPDALGLGTFRAFNIAPAYARLRHMRSGQIL